MVIDIHISKYFTEQYGIWRNRKWLICRSRMMELRNLRSFLLALWAPVNLRIIRRLATTSAFKLLRLVFSVFQTVYWHANGTAKQVREAERPENYRRSAQVLDIRMMHKFCDVQLFAMDNFICTHSRFESPQYVLDNDNINLMFVTETHAVFCEPIRKGMSFSVLRLLTIKWSRKSQLFDYYFNYLFAAILPKQVIKTLLPRIGLP